MYHHTRDKTDTILQKDRGKTGVSFIDKRFVMHYNYLVLLNATMSNRGRYSLHVDTRGKKPKEVRLVVHSTTG